jgi:hypothetical protein
MQVSTPHPYDAMCVCHACTVTRHPAQPRPPRLQLRDDQAEAHAVTRTAFHLIEVTRAGRTLRLSRTGAAYEASEMGTLRRVGTAHVDRNRQIAVHEHGMVRGKAARKRMKRARHEARAAMIRSLTAQQAAAT